MWLLPGIFWTQEQSQSPETHECQTHTEYELIDIHYWTGYILSEEKQSSVSYNDAKPVYFGAGHERDIKRDIESCPLDGVIWDNDLFQLPFPSSGTQQASWRLSPRLWYSDSHCQAIWNAWPACQGALLPVRAFISKDERRQEAGKGRELPSCSLAVWAQGRDQEKSHPWDLRDSVFLSFSSHSTHWCNRRVDFWFKNLLEFSLLCLKKQDRCAFSFVYVWEWLKKGYTENVAAIYHCFLMLTETNQPAFKLLLTTQAEGDVASPLK